MCRCAYILVRGNYKKKMKRIFITILLTGVLTVLYCQNFKFIKPKLTDSTKVVKTEINTKTEFERIYYIDFSENSEEKKALWSDQDDNDENIAFTYSEICKNIKQKIYKYKTSLPREWVKLFKYKDSWVLFNDLPKHILTDTCFVTFYMDDPFSSVITDLKVRSNSYIFKLETYNWEQPSMNLNSTLEIKIIDLHKMITIWKTTFKNEISYEIMVPNTQVSNFPVMVMLETDLMDDENDIFDKIDYKKLFEN